MSRSKGLLWASTPYDVLRKRHVARLRAIHAELEAENERLRLDVVRLTSRLSNDFASSETQVRSAIDRAGAGFVRLCDHAPKLAAVADALRVLGVNTDDYGNMDSTDGALSLGLGGVNTAKKGA